MKLLACSLICWALGSVALAKNPIERFAATSDQSLNSTVQGSKAKSLRPRGRCDLMDIKAKSEIQVERESVS